LLGLCLLLGCSFWESPVKRPTRSPQRSPSAVVSPTPPADGSNPPGGLLPTAGPDASLEPAAPATLAASPTDWTPTITVTSKPSRTPTLTSTITPTPTLNPKAQLLRIAAPGPMSKVVSPIDFVVHISPDFVGNTTIELIGEDGRVLYAKANFRTFATDTTTKVSQKINFEIPGAAEIARLQISTFDKDGHMQAFNSVRLLLLSVGRNQLSPSYPPFERVLLRTPKWDAEVSGGVLSIEGEIQPMNDLPVVAELYDIDGNILGSRILTFKPDNGTYQPFNTLIPYQVEKKTASRLVIHQDDDRISGLAYLYSVEITVSP
jgi:hypothetical protein